MKRPDIEGRGELVQTLSNRLRNRYYKDAPDALGFLDLAPTALGVEPDPIRVLITKTISRTSTSKGLQARSTFSPPSAHRYEAGSSSHSTKGQFLDVEKGNDDAQDDAQDDDEHYEQRTPGVTGLEGVSRPIQHQITAFVDYLSRLLVTIMASLFLIVPMVVLSYVEPKWARLFSASLFVPLFAVYVSLVSKGSNQEMVMSSAAYAAVIVVFVGQTN
jgi:VIT1/CCC1 family predicted Fe2+/Mn2+ transporter